MCPSVCVSMCLIFEKKEERDRLGEDIMRSRWQKWGGLVVTASQDKTSAEQIENKETIKPYCSCFYTSNSFYTDAYEP